MLVLFICSLFLLSCNPFETGGENAPNLEKEMENILNMIHEEIGDAVADDESACRALPIGAKPCGGPWRYIPYSAQESDEAQLEDLADEYYQINQQYNEEKGLISDCAYVGEPPVALENGRCVFTENNTD